MTVQQNDVLRVTAEMTQTADSVQNVYHFRSTNAGAIDDTDVLDDMADIMDEIYALLDGETSDEVSYDQVRVQNVTQNLLIGAIGFPVITVGLNITDPLPRPVAALITYPTAKPKTRGGNYYGGFTEDRNTSTGSILAGTLTNLTSVATLLLAERVFGANSYRMVVFNAVLDTFVLPVSAIIHDIWRTQRRRRQGVGS